MPWLNFRTAALAAAASIALGLWLGWLLAHRTFSGQREVKALLLAALAIPAPVLLYVLPPVLWHAWTITPLGVAVAALLSAVPPFTRAIRTALLALDPLLICAAHGLGASDWRVFWRIELPLAWRPTLTAAALACAGLAAEFAIARWVAGHFLP